MVKVYRRCEANRRWTAVDFSGCVLSSSEQQVLVILSLLANITTDSGGNFDTEALNEEVCDPYVCFSSMKFSYIVKVVGRPTLSCL